MPNQETKVAPARSRDRNGADRLVEAGEILFGKHGLDGPSMRQIQLAAGSSNKYAVQYHFGGLSGLVDAILAKRMPQVDAAQARMLAELEKRGLGGNVHALLDAFYRPLLEHVNDQGERTYARFMSATLVSAEGERHFQSMLHLAPTAAAITRHLRAALPHLSAETLSRRLRLTSVLVCTSMFAPNPVLTEGEEDARLVEDVLNVAAAGLSAPTA